METKKLYFMDCHLAGRMYHDADEVWEGLKVGTLVRLERELDNRHDPNAVMVVYEKDGEEFKIGYIPRGENVELANFLDMGWNNVFECRICKINEEAHPERQVHLTIKIKRNSNN
jgi:hypothetical protein